MAMARAMAMAMAMAQAQAMAMAQAQAMAMARAMAQAMANRKCPVISEPVVTADTLSRLSARLETLRESECLRCGLSDAERQIVLLNIGR